ncbi:MAG TPA: phosphotransferase [Humibacter sp.]|nr:phosphotransferase [Humibacter sp.]
MAATASLLEALAGWIGRQRWFAGKGVVPRLRLVGSLEWRSDHDLRISTHLVVDAAGDSEVLYQVPVILRRQAYQPAEHTRIGAVTDDDGELWHAYDAAHDPLFAQLLLQLVVDGGAIGGDHAVAHGVPGGRSTLDAGRRTMRVLESQVLRGEQSNTSIVYRVDDGGRERGVICKIFRSLHHGENPDVVLQSALFAAGCHYVPATIGSVLAEWPDAAQAAPGARGHLAFAQEFLDGAVDAWRLALSAAVDGRDFTHSAREMGIATADVHATLASVLPTRDATVTDIDDAIAGWGERLKAAVRQIPGLEDLRRPVEALYARARHVSWPRLQRIHGDLHLGQILATGDQRWAIIDFEGEPMRPLAERSLVDVPLRDVAGMLRSFDYVAGSQTDAPGVQEWARSCRRAFVDGYTERTDDDLAGRALLLDAFELDKALYEAVYEARNRPAWVGIPTAAARRLALRAAG